MHKYKLELNSPHVHPSPQFPSMLFCLSSIQTPFSLANKYRLIFVLDASGNQLSNYSCTLALQYLSSLHLFVLDAFSFDLSFIHRILTAKQFKSHRERCRKNKWSMDTDCRMGSFVEKQVTTTNNHEAFTSIGTTGGEDLY